MPDEYNKIEIEDLASGRRLTTRTGEAVDFFHSRLQVSPGGTYLLSAGWVWHPLDCIQVYRIAEVLKDPKQLDLAQDVPQPDALYDIHSAAFQSDDVLLITGDSADSEEPQPYLAGCSLGERKVLFSTPLEAIPGTIMSAGLEHTVGFYGHPKLFENCSGKVVHEWPELKSGQQSSSIIRHVEKIPPLALDPIRKRFAIADEKQITVIQLA